MKVEDAVFIRSAVSAADFPRDRTPQVALVGRSNVGKSTLVNALTKSRVARTSAAPGKTRQVNLYTVVLQGFTPGRLYLADLPGYGYARGGETAAQEFDRLTQEYFAHAAAGRPPAGATADPTTSRPHHSLTTAGPIQTGEGYGPSAALLVVDSRHPGLRADLQAHVWLTSKNLPVAVIASKIDKLNRAARIRALREWEKGLNAEVIPVAATTGEGLDAVWKAIRRLLTAPTGGPTAP
ncbi:MAG: GTPase [Vicinamibacterales bacterium]